VAPPLPCSEHTRSAQNIDIDKRGLAGSDVEKSAKANLSSRAALTSASASGQRGSSAAPTLGQAVPSPAPHSPARFPGRAPAFGQPWPGPLCRWGRTAGLQPGCPREVGDSPASEGQAGVWVRAGVHSRSLSCPSSPFHQENQG